jgi:hypothetical protein
MRSFNSRILVVLLLTLLIACGAGGTLRVTEVQLGRSVNADGTIANHTTTFGPTDTIYVSVLTSGVGSATISVRWTFSGRVVGEPKKEVSYRDTAATEFHLQSPTGFPIGQYNAEILFDGQPVETKSFRVEAQ